MTNEMSRLQKEAGIWQLRQFPMSTPVDLLRKLYEEVEELAQITEAVLAAPDDTTAERRDLAGEMGDVVIVLACLAFRFGIDLQGEGWAKLVENRHATWVDGRKLKPTPENGDD